MDHLYMLAKGMPLVLPQAPLCSICAVVPPATTAMFADSLDSFDLVQMTDE